LSYIFDIHESDDYDSGRIKNAANAGQEATTKMATLECRDDVLYVVEEADESADEAKRWLPVRSTDYAEARTLTGRPVRQVDPSEGTYVDEEGNIYQLMAKGETRPIRAMPAELLELSDGNIVS
jgi:hypothetical protein